uniref:Hyaluronidase n=1 Tax=Meloidogyne floridensis TaxID=298350 RepID=A0A915NM47_9BILA
MIYWAVPSQQCLNKTRKPIEPQKFGIKTNKNQKFHGTEIVIFYEHQLGLYPYLEFNDFDESTNDDNLELNKTLIVKYINGGLPQNINLNDHLEKAKNDILKAIPDPDFSGPAIIDYEKWRPEWSLNWAARRIYQLESTKDVLERFPGISEKSATEIGRELFNKRARKFTVETIRLGRKLRPKALWGFYDTPLCNYDAGERWPVGCLELFRKHNDKLWWLYAEVSALYSSIYLYPGDRKRKKVLCERHMHAKVAEAEWTWSLRRKDRPVILFTKMELDPYSPSQNLFYSKEELFCSYEWTAQLGVDGLIIWSSSKQIGERCHSISVCSTRICHGRGRCILRDRRRHQKPWHGHDHWPRNKFTCICPRNETYYGEYCDLPGPRGENKENKDFLGKTIIS